MKKRRKKKYPQSTVVQSAVLEFVALCYDRQIHLAGIMQWPDLPVNMCYVLCTAVSIYGSLFT